jgi:histidine triad (HIT) family protein
LTAPTGCVFCSIVRGELAASIVYEDERTVAFLDSRPLFIGHTLVVPRDHHETLPDLPTDLFVPLFSTVQLVARGLETGLAAEGTFVAQNNKVSQSVPHVHVHVIPRKFKDGLRGFFFPRQRYTDDEHQAATAQTLAAAIAQLAPGSPTI